MGSSKLAHGVAAGVVTLLAGAMELSPLWCGEKRGKGLIFEWNKANMLFRMSDLTQKWEKNKANPGAVAANYVRRAKKQSQTLTNASTGRINSQPASNPRMEKTG